MRRLALVAVVALCASTSCGGTGQVRPAGERQWVANATQLIDQLHGDVTLASNSGVDVASASKALRDESDLFALLIAYSDFGGCTHMVGDAGLAPDRRFADVERALASACMHLEQASALFTRSTANTDPQSLLAASRQVLDASPLLYRAQLALAAATRRPAR